MLYYSGNKAISHTSALVEKTPIIIGLNIYTNLMQKNQTKNNCPLSIFERTVSTADASVSSLQSPEHGC